MIPVLIDIDGVLKSGNELLPGCQELLQFLEMNNIPSALLSNSTLKDADGINKYFIGKGIEVNFPILTAADATLNYVFENYKSCKVYAEEAVKNRFNSILNEENPEVVVLGDIGNKWDYHILNNVFNFVRNGADIVAMHKNKYWQTKEDGYLLDLGAFVSAIEYASQKQAKCIGKPSKIYFNSALNLIGKNTSENFIMLGDDLETDIESVNRIGGISILLLTGKTTESDIKKSKIKPTQIAKNLFEAIKIINKIIEESNE